MAVVIATAVALLVASPGPAGAQDWGLGNLTATAFNGPYDAPAWDVAVQPDGKQVEAGEYDGDAFVLRYQPSLGRPDDEFGAGGIALLDAGGDERAFGVALQSDGRVVAAGQADGDVALWRLASNGLLDQSFGTAGMLRVDLGTDDDAASSVAILPNGGIVVGGWSGDNVALVRVLTNGALDQSFGTAGKVVTNLGAEERAESVVLTSTGTIVVAGGKGSDSVVLRYSAAGAADPGFGPSGARVIDMGGVDSARDVTVDALDRPVFVGISGQSAYVARMTTGGLLDPTFAGDGSVVTALRGAPAEANGVVTLSDGRIVIAGHSANDASIAAFLTTGIPDPDFVDGNEAWSSVQGAQGAVLYGLAAAADGTLASAGWEPSSYFPNPLEPLGARYAASGQVATTFGRERFAMERRERAADMVLQPDGRSVSVATIFQGQSDGGDIGVVRHLPGGGLDRSFGGDGTVVVDYGPLADTADVATSVALQPDGKILVAGSAACQTGVVRLLPDGTLDPAFGTGGWARVITDPDYVCRPAEDVVVASDGGVLLAVGLSTGPAVIRLTPGGVVDTSWAAGGTAAVPGAIGLPSSLVIRGNGSMLVAGGGAVGVAQLTQAGAVDASFGNAGVAVIDTGFQAAYVDEIVVRPDGRVLVAGGYYAGRYSFSLAQWTASGAADPSFGGGDGWVTTSFDDLGSSSGGLGARAYALALLPDGRFLAGGEDVIDWAFARYLPDGALDPAFGSGGRISLDVDDAGRPPEALAVRGDGAIVGVATVTPGRFSHLALFGLAPIMPPPTTTTTPTTTTPTTTTPTTTTPTTTTPTTTQPTTVPTAAPPPAPPVRRGYWMVTSTGSVYAFGTAMWRGNAVTGSAVDVESTPSGAGYWVVDGFGRVFAFGDATWRGGSPNLAAGETVTSLSRTATGNGYWLFTSRGRVLTYGDAVFRGDMSQARLNGPVLDAIPTRSGNGYFMVGSDGGIFSFGDARFHGSMGSSRLNAPVVSLVPDPDGAGYWLVGSDGGIFAFDAPFYGSMGSTRLNRPVTGMVGARAGYLMVAEDGGIFAFGDAPFSGSLGSNPPQHPVTAVAALP